MKLFIVASTCLLLLFACSNDIEEQELPTLKEASDLLVGTAVIYEELYPWELIDLVLDQFSMITPANALKHTLVWPDGPGSPMKFERSDAMVEFAVANDLEVHGHVLAWYFYDYSTWVGVYTGTPDSLEEQYHHYVTETVGRYPEIRAWDVINEAISDPLFNIVGDLNFADMLDYVSGNYQFEERDYMLPRLLGDDYMAKLFIWAKEANPEAKLFYNDYNLMLFPEKLDKVIALCDRARAAGAPVDGIGFQGHIAFPADITYGDAYRAFKKVADKGYEVNISELAISINGPFGFCTEPPSFSNRYIADGSRSQLDLLVDQANLNPVEDFFCGTLLEEMAQFQARRYYDYVRAYFDAVPPHLRNGITVWGHSDCCHWFGYGAPWLFGNRDWPAIYDEDFQPKPAYFNFLRALQEG